MKSIDAKLVIVGDGPLKIDLMKQAEPMKEKISFLGAKTHQELVSIYASADIFVAPSITASDGDKEGLGLVILEAMASGLPVVASNSGGIPDIVKNGQNGFLVEERDIKGIAEKINSILKDDTLYKVLQSNAIKTAEKYDYRTIAKKYADIIEGRKC